ncbi:hypothetical protein T484DRAFT_1761537 [Baffinella frigidus]|nr:hypothetical protein T484DRAFT_1761537 [Cryptophyta sp. CCMP2293]
MDPFTQSMGVDPPNIFSRTRSAVALAASARNPKNRLRKVVNAVKFIKAMSRKGGRPSNSNLVRGPQGGVHKATNAGVHKATNAGVHKATKGTGRRNEPNAAAGIPLKWGGIEKLEEHWIGGTDVKYLARCETTTDWLTEGALVRRQDGIDALSAYRQENGAVLVKELTELKTRLESERDLRDVLTGRGGVGAKLKRWSSNAVS